MFHRRFFASLSTPMSDASPGMLYLSLFSHERCVLIFPPATDLSARLTLMGWEDLSIQREWLYKVGRELGVKKVHFVNSDSIFIKIRLIMPKYKTSDWYNVSRKDLLLKGGWGLLRDKGSLPTVLSRVYPQFAWDKSKFNKRKTVQRSFWDSLDNTRKFLEDVAPTLGVKQVSAYFNLFTL